MAVDGGAAEVLVVCERHRVGRTASCGVRNWHVNERKALKAVFCDIVSGRAGNAPSMADLGWMGVWKMFVTGRSCDVASVRKSMALPKL